MHVLVGLRPITACICSLYKFFCYQKQFFSFFIKGTVQRDFRPPFFSSFEPAWATDQWVKILSILVKFSLSYLNFYESPRGIIPRGVNAKSARLGPPSTTHALLV